MSATARKHGLKFLGIEWLDLGNGNFGTSSRSGTCVGGWQAAPTLCPASHISRRAFTEIWKLAALPGVSVFAVQHRWYQRLDELGDDCLARHWNCPWWPISANEARSCGLTGFAAHCVELCTLQRKGNSRAWSGGVRRPWSASCPPCRVLGDTSVETSECCIFAASYREENLARYSPIWPAQELTPRWSISTCIVMFSGRDVNILVAIIGGLVVVDRLLLRLSYDEPNTRGTRQKVALLAVLQGCKIIISWNAHGLKVRVRVRYMISVV